MESDRHRDQIDLLIRLLKAWWQMRDRGQVLLPEETANQQLEQKRLRAE